MMLTFCAPDNEEGQTLRAERERFSMVVLDGSTILPCLEGEASGCQIKLKLVDEVRTEHHVPGFVLLALLPHPGEELVDERGVADLVVEHMVFGEPNLDSGLLPRSVSGDVGQLRTLLWRIATAPQRA